MIEILETDIAFKDSPDPGHPLCICSRCGNNIRETESPIRAWSTEDDERIDGEDIEFRYCESCMKKMGVISVDDMPEEQDPFDQQEIITCRQCGCSQNDACVHPQYGSCWWVEDDLCSHCKNWPGQSTRPAQL